MIWQKVQNSIVISGPIDDALFARFVRETEQLKQLDATHINVIINSQGGDEHVGRAIAGYMKSYACFFSTWGFGDVHSAAVIIFAAGYSRKLSKAATIMVHESSAEVEGNSTAIKVAAKQMEQDELFWCNLLQEYTGTDAKVWMKLHNDETFLRPEQALDLKLATEII